MSRYRNPKTSEEFIGRTMKILEQYSSFECSLGEDFFDVTLFLNCLLGLVVLPRESVINKLTDISIPKPINHILTEAKDKKGNEIEVNFKEFIIGLRNGVVHFGQDDSLEFITKDEQIDSVMILSYTNYKKHILKYEIKVSSRTELNLIISEIMKYINFDLGQKVI